LLMDVLVIFLCPSIQWGVVSRVPAVAVDSCSYTVHCNFEIILYMLHFTVPSCSSRLLGYIQFEFLSIKDIKVKIFHDEDETSDGKSAGSVIIPASENLPKRSDSTSVVWFVSMRREPIGRRRFFGRRWRAPSV
jgi:hypothetical protein